MEKMDEEEGSKWRELKRGSGEGGGGKDLTIQFVASKNRKSMILKSWLRDKSNKERYLENGFENG